MVHGALDVKNVEMSGEVDSCLSQHRYDGVKRQEWLHRKQRRPRAVGNIKGTTPQLEIVLSPKARTVRKHQINRKLLEFVGFYQCISTMS